MSHPYKGDVNDLFDDINRVINLRQESEQYRRCNHSRAVVLRKESDQLLKDSEYKLYELLDQAKEDGIRSELATHDS